MAQTSPGTAVYLLKNDLRVPGTKDPEGPGYDLRPRWIAKGTKAGADELSGLVIPALVYGGFVEQVSAPKVSCEVCQEQGSAKDKKATYTLEELQAHYGEAHPAFAAPTEV
jgi:hypothetical protein